LRPKSKIAETPAVLSYMTNTNDDPVSKLPLSITGVVIMFYPFLSIAVIV
jgi:hypothetical protein